MVLALNVSVYFCKLLPLHMNGNLPVGIGMHVFAMICDLIRQGILHLQGCRCFFAEVGVAFCLHLAVSGPMLFCPKLYSC
eukprot:UN0441